MCDQKHHIIIDTIVGTSIGDDLKGCYFVFDSETPDGFNVYDFFDKFDTLIIPGLKVGNQFDFELPYIENKVWALTMTAGSCTFVAGKWTNGHSGFPLPEPDGSYQAQAGGTVPEYTNATAASA